MKISLPTLRRTGKKRRAAVARSKSSADKNVVNMKLLWKDQPVSHEKERVRKKCVSTPDLLACSNVNITDVHTIFTAAGLKRSPVKQGTDAGLKRSPVKQGTDAGLKRSPVKQGTDAGLKRSPVKQGTDAGLKRSPVKQGTDVVEGETDDVASPLPSHVKLSRVNLVQQRANTPIKRSNLRLILPDEEEIGRKRTRSAATQEGVETKPLKSQKLSCISCVQEDCVVCTLAQPHLRHRINFQNYIWREFY